MEVIEQKFLESGHTDMEVDSMHSTIERAKRNIPVYTPGDWATIIRAACVKKPYDVDILVFQDILDLKVLRNKVTTSQLSVAKTGEAINWMDIKVIKVCKSHPESIFIKKSYSQEYVELAAPPPRARRGRPSQEELLPKKYATSLPISAPKKADLMKLCKDGTIPKAYQEFYEKLKCVEKKDRLPEPDARESDPDTN